MGGGIVWKLAAECSILVAIESCDIFRPRSLERSYYSGVVHLFYMRLSRLLPASCLGYSSKVWRMYQSWFLLVPFRIGSGLKSNFLFMFWFQCLWRRKIQMYRKPIRMATQAACGTYELAHTGRRVSSESVELLLSPKYACEDGVMGLVLIGNSLEYCLWLG